MDNDNKGVSNPLYCMACTKQFKTDNSFIQHERTKKHKQNLKKYKETQETNENQQNTIDEHHTHTILIHTDIQQRHDDPVTLLSHDIQQEDTLTRDDIQHNQQEDTLTRDADEVDVSGTSRRGNKKKKQKNHVNTLLKKEIKVHSLKDFDRLTQEAFDQDKTVIVLFTAVWCGFCKRITPLFADLSEEYENAVFLKVDYDHLTELVDTYQVRSIPTFVALGDNQLLETVNGADESKLRYLVSEYCSPGRHNRQKRKGRRR
eukprot:TRINITY_DN10533_c0_g1_i1.p1 TRINITY_DN10533_c0_g1~~TRINITY_DN10533_c0_g1_i1.p1  ORF type:complete len:260 (+),score=51.08 TRINITY_DN10533_c0_g1_i1:136-915(+)